MLDANNPTKSLLDLIDERTNARLDKIKQDLKRNMKKNYLVDSRNQELTPIVNGQKSKKASTATTSTLKKKKPKKGKAATTKQPPTAPLGKGGAMPKQKK